MLTEERKVFLQKSVDAIGYALYNAAAIFNNLPGEILPMLRIAKEALTFDDVLLVPAHSTVLPNTADLSTQLTKTIRLNIPMLSAAMDTVTEARLAIALAQEGGIGFIHKHVHRAPG